MKGRREAIGPGISELSSSVQKSVKCLLHFHAYLVVVGFLPCFSHALLGSGCLLCRSPFSGQVEGARPAGMEQQSPEGDPKCQGQDIPYTPMGRGKEITVEAVVKKEESSEASSSTEDKKAEPASASTPPGSKARASQPPEESSSSSSVAPTPAKAPRPKAQGRHTPTQVLREQSGKEWWSSSKITRSKTRPDKAQREENRRKEEQRQRQREQEWSEWYHSTPSGSGASSSSAYPWAGWNWSGDWEAHDWSSWSWWEQPASSSAEPSAPPGDGEANTWTSHRPRPRSPPRPRRGDESKPKSAGISLKENPTWLNRSTTPTREETSTPLRLRPNVKSELEDEVYAAAAEIAAGDPIEVSDEENDWNQCCAEPSTGPRRPESEVPALWGMSRANRRRPTEAHHYLPPQLTAYRTSAGVLLKQPIVLQSLNKGQSRIVYSITNGIVMKITSRLEEHGDEHSFSLQFSAFCARVLGLRILRTELVQDGQTTVHQFPALFQERVFRLTQWLERWGNSLEGVEKTALGYYLLGLLGSIMLSKVRPRDFGSSNLGVRSLDQRACELVLYDLASWERHSDVYRARLNINPAYEWLEKALGHSFHMHLRVYQDMYSRPEELVPFCLSQCDLFREHAERQFGAHLTIP